MPTTHDQIIRHVLGQMADEAPSAYEFTELASTVVVRPPQGQAPTWQRTLIPFGAVVFVVILGFAVFQSATEPTVTTPNQTAPPNGTPSPHDIVDAFISESREDVSYVVGVGETGLICATVSGPNSLGGKESLGSCGISDGIRAMAMQGERLFALAGYTSMPVGEMTAVFDNGDRVRVDVMPVPDQGAAAFGLIHEVTSAFVGLEVRDLEGDLVQVHYPTVGPIQQEQ